MNRFGRILGFAMCVGLVCTALQASAQVQYRRAVRPSVTPLPTLGFSYVSFPGGAFPVTGAPHTIVLYEVARPLRPGGPAECNRPLTFALQLSVHNAGPGDFIRNKTYGDWEVVNVNIGSWSGLAKLPASMPANSSQSMNFDVTLPTGNYMLAAKISLGDAGAALHSNSSTLNWPLEIKCGAQFAAPAPIRGLGVPRL
jgi:hypothetical protein